MARLPASIPDLVAQFGPHLNREPAGGWTTRGEPDRIVPTHCCFCGQQCGIQLKVKDEKIVGFEPWEEFPFNKGKLCPKGVKRYMQDEHPDRLLTPLARDEARGFQPIDWDAALDRTAREIQRIQAALRTRRLRRADRRLADQREGVPDGQVRARRACGPRTSTTTAGSAWCRRRPRRRRSSASIAAPTRGATSRRRR